MTRRIVIAHGGTGSKPDQKDGAEKAAKSGLKALEKGDALEAVVEAVRALEDDGRFNAGTGASPRFDGVTHEMDAACMDSRNRYGAVTAIRHVKNPILVAREVVRTPNNVIAGEGATNLARRLGHAEFEPGTKHGQKTWKELMDKIRKGEDTSSDNEWSYESLRKHWNYARPFEAIFPEPWAPRKGADTRGLATEGSGGSVGNGDTVGAVATDGKTFAAAASTGGTITTLLGRVGDSPAIGCGIFAGECGAVALTGNGDHLTRERAATMVHGWLNDGFTAREAIRRLTSRYAASTDIFGVIVGLSDHATGGNRDVAWAVASDEGGSA